MHIFVVKKSMKFRLIGDHFKRRQPFRMREFALLRFALISSKALNFIVESTTGNSLYCVCAVSFFACLFANTFLFSVVVCQTM